MRGEEHAAVGVITGVGLSGSSRGLPEVEVPTPYGPTSGPVRRTTLHGTSVAVLARRGDDDELQPHLVPYRANIWALASLGVRVLITSSASSGLRDTFPPGTFVISDQLIDRTHGREITFFDEGPAVQVHSAEPFDATLRGLAVEVLKARHLRFRDFGTTVVVNGPRFPAVAETRAHAAMGADLSNMTLMPETALALELGMAVVNVSFVTDREGATAADHPDATGFETMRRRIQQAESTFTAALGELIALIPSGFNRRASLHQPAIDEVLSRPVRDSAGG